MRNIFLLFLVFTFVSLPLGAYIASISSLQEAEPHLSGIDPSTLLLLEERVLIQPSNPAFQKANMQRHKGVVRKVLLSLFPEQKELFFNLMVLDSPSQLIDSEAPTLIAKWQQAGAAIMGITRSFTGPAVEIGIDSLEKEKIERLQRLGIDFSQSAPLACDLIFWNLPSYRRNYSLYSHGILFLNGKLNSKSKTLQAFFAKSHFYPQKIIFFSDSCRSVQEMEGMLLHLEPHIEFVGLYYMGAENYPSLPLTEKEFSNEWKRMARQAQKNL